MRLALLIGINAYVDRPLQGCVRDVQAIRKYIESEACEADASTVSVQVMTATRSQVSHDGTCQLEENPQSWPTYENVMLALKSLSSAAKDGDLICFYYSGHGIRIPPSQMNNHSGDVALALVARDNAEEIRYMKGAEISHVFNELGLKNCQVAVILDCCFAGGVSRHDSDADMVRSMEYSPEVDKASTPPQCNPQTSTATTGRDISMLPNWITSPDRYSVLAACGPHEEAREIEFKDKTRHGALTYFLLRVLQSKDALAQMPGAIYSQLASRFSLEFPRQNPILYGQQELGFFATAHSSSKRLPAGIMVASGKGSHLQLQAGLAHGLCSGDTVGIFAPGCDTNTESHRTPNHSAIARIGDIRSLSGDLEIVSGIMNVHTIKRGWIARPRTMQLIREYSVGIDVPPAEQAAWEEAVAQRPLLNSNFTGSRSNVSPFCTIYRAENGDIGIRVEPCVKRLAQFPTRPCQAAPGEVLDLTEQLIWSHHVESISNLSPSPQFLDTFALKCTNRCGEELDIVQAIDVNHEDYIWLEMKNKGTATLYVHLYSLGQRLEVKNILKAPNEIIPASDDYLAFTGFYKKKLKATIPEQMLQRGQTECDDVVKIFLTTQPGNFSFLEKEKIGSSAKTDQAEAGAGVSVEEGGRITNSILREEWVAYNLAIHVSIGN